MADPSFHVFGKSDYKCVGESEKVIEEGDMERKKDRESKGRSHG